MGNDTEDLGKVFAVLWGRRWLILAIPLIAALLTYVYYDQKPRVYASQTSVLLGTSKLEEILRGEATALDDRALNNQATLLMSARFAESVRRRLTREGHPRIPRFDVLVTSGEESDFLNIEARSSSPQAAALVANALADELIAERKGAGRAAYEAAAGAARQRARRTTATDASSIRERGELLKRAVALETYASVSEADARQVDVAQPSAAPLSPRPLRNAIFGFVLALAIASAIVWFSAQLDRRVRSLADAELLFGRPVLAAIPPLRRALRPGVRGPEPADGVREPLRRVLTTLQLDAADQHGEGDSAVATRKILVTSAQAGEGKSMIAANLALVARELGAAVALIDADLDAPALSRLLSVGAVPGLSDVGAGRISIEDAWQRVENVTEKEPVAAATQGLLPEPTASVGDLRVLTSGTRVEASGRTVSESIPPVLNWSEERFDYVIVDSPPPLAVSDALPLLSAVDAVVVVARLGETKVPAGRRLAELMERLPTVSFVGVIANDVPGEERDAFGFVPYSRS